MAEQTYTHRRERTYAPGRGGWQIALIEAGDLEANHREYRVAAVAYGRTGEVQREIDAWFPCDGFADCAPFAGALACYNEYVQTLGVRPHG